MTFAFFSFKHDIRKLKEASDEFWSLSQNMAGDQLMKLPGTAGLTLPSEILEK